MKVTREQAIELLCRVTDQDDPYWEHLTGDFWDEETNDWPTLNDVLIAVGITQPEIDKAEGVSK